MSSIVGPYAGVENDYRRERITRVLRAPPQDRGTPAVPPPGAQGPAVTPAIDWFGE